MPTSLMERLRRTKLTATRNQGALAALATLGFGIQRLRRTKTTALLAFGINGLSQSDPKLPVILIGSKQASENCVRIAALHKNAFPVVQAAAIDLAAQRCLVQNIN